MIACVDVGGTKTLLGLAEPDSERPVFSIKHKIKTPDTYTSLLEEIKNFFNSQEATVDVVSIGYPGEVDPANRRIVRDENLGWKAASLGEDLLSLVPGIKHVLLENDANLGGLAEATSGAGTSYSTVYYLTISTGIGGGYIADGVIEPHVGNSEPGHMVFRDGRLQTWEQIASGRAFLETFGQTAAKISSKSDSWRQYAHNLTPGFINIVALCNPEAIIVGGGIGAHFDKWWPHLENSLQQHMPTFLKTPNIKAAHHAEEAVLEGAFYYAKQNS